MTLEAVVFPQDQFTYGCKDYLYSLVGGGNTQSEESWSKNYGSQSEEKDLFEIVNNNNIDYNTLHANWDSSSPSVLQNVKDQWYSHSSPENTTTTTPTTTTSRRKRRRTKSIKNLDDIESQRMTHIVVERNRRKQMNEYLSVLRSLMPPSYVQRGDQASIIGGAINFVKELEQLLQHMNGKKKTKEEAEENGSTTTLAEFFTFPQYSIQKKSTCEMMINKNESRAGADIEVTLVDSHANIKILLKKRHGHIMKIVVGLQTLGFNILHLNVTTLDDMVLVSVSVKVEEMCQMNTVDEIAAAVNQLSLTLQEDAVTFS